MEVSQFLGSSDDTNASRKTTRKMGRLTDAPSVVVEHLRGRGQRAALEEAASGSTAGKESGKRAFHCGLAKSAGGNLQTPAGPPPWVVQGESPPQACTLT